MAFHTCLSLFRYLNSKNGLSGQYQIATIEATPGLCSQNLIFLMYMIHSSSILVYLCIDITQINFHQFFSTYFTKHVQTHNYPTRNAQDYSINKTKRMFSDCAIRNCGPTFWNSLDKALKHCKTTKHFRNQLKSILLSEYNWLHFGACLVCFCVLCLSVKCIFLQACWNLC